MKKMVIGALLPLVFAGRRRKESGVMRDIFVCVNGSMSGICPVLYTIEEEKRQGLIDILGDRSIRYLG